VKASMGEAPPSSGFARLRRALWAAYKTLKGEQSSDATLVTEFVDAVYRLHLGRPPGAGEIALRQAEFKGGMGAAAFTKGVRDSEEASQFQRLATSSTAPYAPSLPPKEAREPDGGELESLVRGLYLGFLGREPEPGIMQDWRRAALDGVAFVDMARQIRDSEEAARAAQAGHLAFSRKAAETIISALYRVAVGEAGRVEDWEPWVTELQAGRSLAECAEELSASRGSANSRPSSSERRPAEGAGDGLSAGAFVLEAYEALTHRAPALRKLEALEQRLRTGLLSRDALLMDLFRRRHISDTSHGVAGTGIRVSRLGTNGWLSLTDWRHALAHPDATWSRSRPRFPTPVGENIVSIICDLEGLGDKAQRRLDEVLAQTIFRRCELIVVAPGPGLKALGAVVECKEDHPNVRLLFSREPAGGRCNLALSEAKGRYLTRMACDTCLRDDALEHHAATLDALPFVDVIYHDFIYSLEPDASFERAAQANLRAELPNVTSGTLYEGNLVRQAPMWRAGLHRSVGLFDPELKWAFDYDFWLRCFTRGLTFFKLDEVLSSYLISPSALTSKADAEVETVRLRHASELLGPVLLESFDTFTSQVGVLSGAAVGSESSRYAALQAALLSLGERAHGRTIRP
jgi:hypothetical protein